TAACGSLKPRVGSEYLSMGLGSNRYRVTYRGPGGHSWGAFGLVNPDLIREARAFLDEETEGRPYVSPIPVDQKPPMPRKGG
ncbi:MAG: hypothetical protein E4G90_07520, partial [Gemmatimonadales bacterium]